MRRRRIAALAAIIIILLAGTLLYLLRPTVAIIGPELPHGYELIPRSLSFSYRFTDSAPADAVIVLSDEGYEGEGFRLSDEIDASQMWKTALSEGRECLLYEESDTAAAAIAEALMEDDDNAFEVTYQGRIASASLSQTLERIGDADRIFLLTPASSIIIARSAQAEAPVVMDFRDSAALEITACGESVGIDWKGLIESIRAGEPHLPYALITR